MAMDRYDCIVVGGGHAGCEAAAALAKLEFDTLLISGNLDRLGYLSCNPAIGGLAKSHMVREIDALGGHMAQWADEAGIQFRVLNMRKGPAVRATRGQMDRPSYQAAVRRTLFNLPHLRIWQDNVVELISDGDGIAGVRTALEETFYARHVLLATGTFLDGRIYIGSLSMSAGRMGDSATHGITQCLNKFGIRTGRLKTGTTPRLLRSTIDFSHLEEQRGDEPAPRFSFFSDGHPLPQTSCYITWTNEKAHTIIRSGFDRAPLFTGVIKGTGARYCPSIEDKVARFPERERHQIFLEPEGLYGGEIYANGISTSLPLDIQQAMIREIRGLENAIITRPGYAIEYDFANPMQLWPTLESKKMPGLWCAGQINGTSGYEEAAAQGLWAALNIAAKEKGLSPFLPGRDRAYMSVLVDDLVTLGTEEPYRMFTSRAEHRLLLREDNALMRLAPLGHQYGLLTNEKWQKFCKWRDQSAELQVFLRAARMPSCHIPAGGEKAENPYLPMAGKGKSVAEELKKPETTLENIFNDDSLNGEGREIKKHLAVYDPELLNMVETDIKYEGYIKRQMLQVRKQAKLEGIRLPHDLNYANISGLSREVEEKLEHIKPSSLGQASRISGITPAAIACLEIHLRKMGLYNSREC